MAEKEIKSSLIKYRKELNIEILAAVALSDETSTEKQVLNDRVDLLRQEVSEALSLAKNLLEQ